MLRVPVISAVGHERDSTLIDDVAAVACSTPTHAAEAAVPLDCLAARRDLERARRARCGGPARARSAPAPGTWSRSPAARRGRCGASASRSTRRRARSAPPPNAASPSALGFQRRIAVVVLERGRARRGRRAPRLRAAAARRCARARGARSRAHDPERTLERGYALAETGDGEPVTSAAAARRRRARQTALRRRQRRSRDRRTGRRLSEKPESYEAAVERLEEIIDRLDSGQAGLRETLDLCRRAASWSPTAPPSSTRSARA